MRVYLMTDLEGVSGVRNATDWLSPGDLNYGEACQLLTAEVNAAIRGFERAGATRIRVVDGHGHGGIDQKLLSSGTEYYRASRPNPYPFGLDDGFDVMGWVGQHAKSGAKSAHLPHTGSFNVIDYRINGVAVGEMEQIALCAELFGVMPIFAAGDKAFTREAEGFLPGIHTVSVKEGLAPLKAVPARTERAYREMNKFAHHVAPAAVHRMLEQTAFEALTAFVPDQRHESGFSAPWSREISFREYNGEEDVTSTGNYPSVLALLNDLLE